MMLRPRRERLRYHANCPTPPNSHSLISGKRYPCPTRKPCDSDAMQLISIHPSIRPALSLPSVHVDRKIKLTQNREKRGVSIASNNKGPRKSKNTELVHEQRGHGMGVISIQSLSEHVIKLDITRPCDGSTGCACGNSKPFLETMSHPHKDL